MPQRTRILVAAAALTLAALAILRLRSEDAQPDIGTWKPV